MGRCEAATVWGEATAATESIGLAPVHKEVTKRIKLELVPV